MQEEQKVNRLKAANSFNSNKIEEEPAQFEEKKIGPTPKQKQI
jgi:Spy/CpxP family protein refolding chaperone